MKNNKFLNHSTPEPTGKYKVGYNSIDLYDQTRPYDKPDKGWLIPIRIYFPINLSPADFSPHELEPENRAIKVWEQIRYNTYSKRTSINNMQKGKWPLVFMNHGLDASSTDYSWICEELASHGYIVISILHQLDSNVKNTNSYHKDYSILLHARFVENILFVHKWLQDKSKLELKNNIDFSRVCLMGHSFGANSILLLLNRTIGTDQVHKTILPVYENISNKHKECVVLMDPNHIFSFPDHVNIPIHFQISEERSNRFKKAGVIDKIKSIGHQVNVYDKSKHISFLDHGYLEPDYLANPQGYFSGTTEQRELFFNKIRKNIRKFIASSLN